MSFSMIKTPKMAATIGAIVAASVVTYPVLILGVFPRTLVATAAQCCGQVFFFFVHSFRHHFV